VLVAAVRLKRRADRVVPDALLAKFRKTEDDVTRLRGASALAEELLARLRALRLG
jgi:hypothetical protein